MIIRTYDDWLSLSHEAQIDLLSRWDAYRHEMFWVPMMAASRLAATSEHSVTDIYVGIYHGGAYVLHLSVSAKILAYLPAPLEQMFEGFPVIWLQSTQYVRPISDELYGQWVSKGIIGDFEIEVINNNGHPSISARRVGADEQLQILDPSFDGPTVEFYTREPNQTAVIHRLTVQESPNCCNHHMSFGQIATKT